MILYEGKSQLDGAPIVAIATFSGKNAKTGALVQTWIMRADYEPHIALKTGLDKSVCGNCKHRPANLGSCYVRVFQAPLSVYRAYKRGKYAKAPRGWAKGLDVRLGSYGDPAAVPTRVWAAVKRDARSATGYTHQWRAHADLMPYCMASVDSVEEAFEARAMGWRTFRVRTKEEGRMGREFVCPASDEAGKKLKCADCMRCGGADGTRGVPVIIAHGGTAVRFTARI